VPTDADYAMEIISKRVAAGLDVRPTRKVKRKTHSHSGSESTATVNDIESASRSLSGPASTQAAPGPSSSSVDWRKWTDRAHKGKTWALEGRRILTGKEREPGDIDDGTSAAGPSHSAYYPIASLFEHGILTLSSISLQPHEHNGARFYYVDLSNVPLHSFNVYEAQAQHSAEFHSGSSQDLQGSVCAMVKC